MTVFKVEQRLWRCWKSFVVAAVVLAALPAASSAEVLVSGIYPKVVRCHHAVKPGIWYQSFSGGPRWARITIRNRRGKVVWRRRAKATNSWRYWRFRGACGSRYVLTYATAAGLDRYPFRVRRR